MEEKKYLDLLIVDVSGKTYVVKAPSSKASCGDLVEFEVAPGMRRTGSVADLVWCQEDDDTYRCFGHIAPIYSVKRVYRFVGSDDDDNKIPADGGGE